MWNPINPRGIMSQRHPMKRHSPRATLKFEETTRRLADAASKFPRKSKEHRAIEFAAKALLFACNEENQVKFAAFLATFDSDLTEQQKERLRGMGISV
jgi:hypothetical protein